jgi:hypothetical protein
LLHHIGNQQHNSCHLFFQSSKVDLNDFIFLLGYEIRKHVHNNRVIKQGVIRISERNEFITPSSIHNCKDANFFFKNTYSEK